MLWLLWVVLSGVYIFILHRKAHAAGQFQAMQCVLHHASAAVRCPASALPPAPQVVVAVVASLAWMSVSSGLILLNKDLLSHGFHYPMALSGLGMAFSGTASYVCCRVGAAPGVCRTAAPRKLACLLRCGRLPAAGHAARQGCSLGNYWRRYPHAPGAAACARPALGSGTRPWEASPQGLGIMPDVTRC